MTKVINERELVLAILLEITRDHVYSHVALKNVLENYQYLDKKERAFITRVTEGTLEHLLEIDYMIDQFSKTKVHKMKPVIATIIRSAVYQLKYMDSVPNSAVCNEAVKLARKKGFQSLSGFVNGVLRNIERNLENIEYPDESDIESYLSIRYSMPKWLVKQWLTAYGRRITECMLTDFQKEKPTSIRVNLSKGTTEELIKKLTDEGVTVERHPYLPYALCISGYNYLGELQSFQEGAFQVQDVSSMLAVEAAAPKEGDIILDVCAAPGGKALHAADMLRGSGSVEARDLTDYKIRLLEENCRRSGMKNMKVTKQDAAVLTEADVGRADIVLADLPCSGLGVLGKKTDLKYKITPDMTDNLCVLQRQILETVQAYVKPGGILLYSTCTTRQEENMEQVRWFLERFPFTTEDIRSKLPKTLQTETTEEGCLQLLPGVHACDGFFIAKLRRLHEGH